MRQNIFKERNTFKMGTDRIIYIRTDGNSQIASGHLVRCFSLANACKNTGMEIHFLVSDAESAFFLQNNLSADYPVTILKKASYDDLERELPELLSLLSHAEHKHLIFLLDSYFVTENYLTAIRPLAKLVYLDDLMMFDYPVDLLVNYDVIPERKLPAYQAAYRCAGRLLLGAGYAPLRGQFLNKIMPLRKQPSNLLLTTGGSDPCHFCLAFIRHMTQKPLWNKFRSSGFTFHIVIGSMNTDKEALYKLVKGLPSIKLHQSLDDIASLMESCDLAVSACGTTLYELCAVGVPAISYTMADNQLPSAKAFEETGAIPYAGDIRQSMKQVLDRISLFLSDMLTPEKADQASALDHSLIKRKAAHEAMRSLVDGNGSSRIAKAISEL